MKPIIGANIYTAKNTPIIIIPDQNGSRTNSKISIARSMANIARNKTNNQKLEHSQPDMLVAYVVKRKIKFFTYNILLFTSIIS